MPLAAQLNTLATRVATEFKSVRAAIALKLDTAGVGLVKSGTTVDVGTGGGLTGFADYLAVDFTGSTGSATGVARSDHTHASTAGLSPEEWVKASVRVVASGSVTYSGTQMIDGVLLSVGDRVLLPKQAVALQNGIYNVNAGTWQRSADANTASKMAGAVVNVDEGSAAGQVWSTTFQPTHAIDSTPMYWSRVMTTNDTAGGSLTGYYPNPTIAAGAVTPAMIEDLPATPVNVNDPTSRTYVDMMTSLLQDDITALEGAYLAPAKNMSTLAAAYPIGISHFSSSSAPDGGLGYPEGAFSNVITMKHSDARIVQINVGKTATTAVHQTDTFWYRVLDPTNETQWGPWRSLDPTPIGSMMMFAGGGVAPSGWLHCIGQTYDYVQQPMYKPLYDVIGTTFGAGDPVGITKFQLPDMRSRFPVGVSSTIRDLGAHEQGHLYPPVETLAVRDVRLDHRHDHSIDPQVAGNTYEPTGTGSGNAVPRHASYSGHSHGGKTSIKGVSDLNVANHAQLALNFIIKY